MDPNRRHLLLAIAALSLCAHEARAQGRRRRRRGRDDDDHDDDDDHEKAARAREAGEIAALTEILDEVQRHYPGEVVGVELERDDGRWIYEIRVLQPGGRYVEVEVDAHTGRVLEVDDD